MAPGSPFSVLAFHRMADRPTNGRAAALGAAMALTAYSCAYYGVFIVLMVGVAVLLTAAMRRQWRNGPYWSAVLVAAGVASALVLPLFAPYALRQSAGGFNRTLREAERYAADWHSYLASAARLHIWMTAYVRPWRDVAFPGYIAAVFGLGAVATARRLRGRAPEIVILYGGI